MAKVAFYGRYSSANQTEQSIEGQLHVCQQYAEYHGLEIVAEYIDRAQSGTSDKRPEFQRMITDSDKGMFEGVLVYKLDRFARSRFDSVVYKRKLRDNGVRVISATENITDTPEGIIMESVLEGMDEYYSAELSRKMHRGKQESFNKGKFIGSKPPYGYAVKNHRLVIDETRAPVAREIFERYASGERYTDLLAWLNGSGIPNGGGNEWSGKNFNRMLHNTIYKGEYRCGGLDGVQPCPAIVDAVTFDKVQERLEKFVHMARERRTGFQYVLTGRLYCGKCGRHFCGHSMTAGGKEYHYYKCNGCGKLNYRAEYLHEQIIKAVAEYLTEEKINELAEGAYRAYQSKKRESPRLALESELRTVEKQLQNAAQAILRGVSIDTLIDAVEQLKARRESLRAAILNTESEMPEFTLNQFRYILKTIVEKPETEILATFVNRIIMQDDVAVVCVNLTRADGEPPLEQFCVALPPTEQRKPYAKIVFCGGWMMFSAYCARSRHRTP